MKLSEIHKALEKNKKVYWHNELYEVLRSPVRSYYKDFDTNHETHLNGFTLEIWCESTSFGGLATLEELESAYIGKN